MSWFKKLESSLLWLFISLHNLHFIEKAINSLRKVNVIEFTNSSSAASHDYGRWYFLVVLKLYLNPIERDSDVWEVFHLGFTKYYNSSILTFSIFLSALYMSHGNAIIVTFLIIFRSNLVAKGLPVGNKGQYRKRKKNSVSLDLYQSLDKIITFIFELLLAYYPLALTGEKRNATSLFFFRY